MRFYQYPMFSFSSGPQGNKLSQGLVDHETSLLLMEREVRMSLGKLQRLSDLIPEEDPRTVKAKKDYTELNK